MRLLVTGAAGFIGSNFVRWLLLGKGKETFRTEHITVLDSLTYAGNLENLADLEETGAFDFVRGDIRDDALIRSLLKERSFDAVVNFAAESHVDRSILDPLQFVRTNVEGTQVLLECAREAKTKRFLQISTDEVYGSLGPTGRFTEETPLDPSSAYSASKAGADLLVIAAYRTHGMNVCVSRCSNNYGPYQFPEKLIPLFITNALNDQPLPLYGDGKNIRSWIHVDDHSRAIRLILEKGRPGQVYNIGGAPESERENAEVTSLILSLLNKPSSLIRFVEDRKGHDRRYAVDYSKIERELGWRPEIDFLTGIKDTIAWYQENQEWWMKVKTGEYQSFYERYYQNRFQKAEGR